ncbi:MAG: DUF4358 domain-containing protein [Oscillospiraceae bacterium]
MKKRIFAAVAVISSIMLSGCGGNTVSEQPTSSAAAESPAETKADTAETSADLQAIYDKIIASQTGDELVMLPESAPEIMDSYYAGLSDLELKQQLLYMAPVTGFACEVMLVEAKDSENADKAEEIFRGRIELGSSEDFYPETAAAWQTNAQVQRSGNLVCMIALPEGHDIPDDVFAL